MDTQDIILCSALLSLAISLLSPVIVIVCGHRAAKRHRTYGTQFSRVVATAITVVGYLQLLVMYTALFTSYGNWAILGWCGVTATVFVLVHLMALCGHYSRQCAANDEVKKSNRRCRIILLVVGYLQILAIPLTLASTNPGFMESRTKSQTRACVTHMRNIDGAYQQYSLDHTNGPAVKAVRDLVPAYLDKESKCPLGRGQSYILTNDIVVCPVAEECPDHRLY